MRQMETTYNGKTFETTGREFPTRETAQAEAREFRAHGENARVRKLEGGYHERYGLPDVFVVVLK